MRRKTVSKRRWIARFRLGKNIPAIAVLQYPGLQRRLKPATHLAYTDHIRRATVYEAAGGWAAFATGRI